MNPARIQRGHRRAGCYCASDPSSTVKLPGFWPHSPEMWFHKVDCIFATEGMTSSFDKYCHPVTALQHESLCLISDIWGSLPVDRYATVKACLNTSHQMTDYQRPEKLFAMQPLGNLRPSQMIAIMLEMCPLGDANSKLFPAVPEAAFLSAAYVANQRRPVGP